MKKPNYTWLIAILLFTATIVSGQTTTTNYKVKKSAVLTYDADSIVTTVLKHDTVFRTLPADTNLILAMKCGLPVTDSLTAILYVDKWLSRLGIAAEEDKTIAYALQTDYNTLGIYSLSSIFGDPLLELKQRAFNKKAHGKKLKLEAEISGSASAVAALIKFNKECLDPAERFDYVNDEWEPWNQTDLVAAATKDTNQLKAQKIALAITKERTSEYWGWLKKFSSKFQEVLIKNTDHLPLHYYQGIPSISYHGSETDSLNAIAKRLGIIYDIRPIFSWETMFSDDELKTQGSPRKVYTNWKIQFDAKHYSNLITKGYYGFAQSQQETVIPYKAPASFLRSIFKRKYIQDDFVNSTSEEHLRMSIDSTLYNQTKDLQQLK